MEKNKLDKIAKILGKNAESARILKGVHEIEESTEKSGWDGSWFLRAYDGYGHKVGSKECAEGQIFIEPQGFCVMAGIGKATGQAAQHAHHLLQLLGTATSHGLDHVGHLTVLFQQAVNVLDLDPRTGGDPPLAAGVQQVRILALGLGHG